MPKNSFQKILDLLPSLLIAGFVTVALFLPQGNKFDTGGKVTVTLFFAFAAIFIFAVSWLGKRQTQSEMRMEAGVAGPEKVGLKRIDLFKNILLLVYVLWTVLSFFKSQTANFGFTEVLVLCGAALLFLSRRKVWQPKLLAIWGIVLLVLTSAAGFGLYLFSHHDRVFGLFFDPSSKTDAWPNAFALFVILLWPLLGYAIWKNRRLRWLKIAALGLVFAAFILSFSRAGLIVLLVQVAALLIGGWKLLMKDKHFHWKQLLPAAGVIIVTLALVGGAQYLRQNYFNKATVQFSDKVQFNNGEAETSIQERLDYWKGGIKLALQEPLFGYGPMSFGYVYRSIQTEWLAIADHPHNVFIKIAAESGLIAMLSFLGFLLTIAWKVVRNFKILREEKKFPLVILCVAFAGALAHNLVDYNLNFATNAVIFWLLLIFIDETATGPVAAALPHHAASPHTVPSLHHATKAKMDSRIDAACWTGLVILAVTASFALAESYSYLQISLASRNPKQVNGQALLALESNSLYSTYSLLDQANKALAKGENALAEQYYVVQVRKNPWDAGAFNSLGELEAKAGQPTQALGYFDQALLLDNKNYWLYYLNKLEALQSLNDTAGLAAFSDQLATEFAQYVPEAETNIHFTAQSQNALVAETVLKNLLKTGSGNAAVFQQDLDQLTAAVAKFQGPGQGFQEAA